MDSQLCFNIANVFKLVFFYFRKVVFLLCIYMHLGNDISMTKNGITLGAKDWSKSLLSIILELSLSKLLAPCQELCLYQSITWDWQMKYLGGILGEFHLFRYFFYLLF